MSNSPTQIFRAEAASVDSSHPVPVRPRTRTMSLLSVSSTSSFRSLVEVTKSRSTSAADQSANAHEAYGSFVPVRSATATLRNLASCQSPLVPRPSARRRRVTFDDKVYSFENESCTSPPEQVPYITRSYRSSPPSPPSRTSSSSSMTPSNDATPDLHPILAKLEKKSKLCSQMVYCSTCQKPGRDYPRCGKCGEMWCSRSCRLVDGKRHVCSA